MRPRLLFISPRFLFPADEGGKIRTSNILREMKGGAFSITLASPAPANVVDYHAEIVGICDNFLSWPEHEPSKLGRILALANALPVSVATDRSAAGSALVERTLQSHELVVTDFPHAAVLLPKKVNIPSVLFTHNVEAEIYERHSKVAVGLWRPVWRDQARKMARFEAAVCRAHDCVIAVSDRDAKAIQGRYGMTSREIVTGVDLEYFASTPQAPVSEEGGTVVFTGVMDSPANIDGVSYLLREIWPQVLLKRPKAELVVVGRNPPEQIISLARNPDLRTRVTGFVEDIRPHVASADVAVIPLRVGGGTRIKAFEAMAMNRPVVSTAIGIEGLNLTPTNHYLEADTADQFVGAILALLGDISLRADLASRSRQLLEARFTWTHVARQFEAICLDTLSARAR